MGCSLSETSCMGMEATAAAVCFPIDPDECPVQQWNGAGEIEHSQVCAPAPAPFISDLLVQYTNNLHLATIREHILRKAGFAVVSALATSDVWLPSSGATFAALFCQTVQKEQALDLLAQIRKSTGHVSTLRLTHRPMGEEGFYDTVLESPVAPARLVEEAAKLRGLLRRVGHGYA